MIFMLLAIDVGNTNITLGVFSDEALLFTARLSTDKSKTRDQYAFEIGSILRIKSKAELFIEDCIIASVVPETSLQISGAVSELFGIVPLILGPGVKTGLNIKIDNPAQLGADLAAGAVGAIAEYRLPCIIIDMGTASTVSVVDKNGCFIGGIIAAGVKLTLKALCENTSQLPSIHIEAPSSIIGKNSADCMRSGLVFGTAAMIDGVIDRIEKELGEKTTVVATGGLSNEIIKYCTHPIIHNENLLLDGLRIIYEKNC